jgi:hypothetical protein
MAIWQWSFFVFPEIELKKRFLEVTESLDNEKFESTNWWKLMSRNTLISFLNTLLLVSEDCTEKGFIRWGNVESDDIVLQFEDGVVTDLCFRLDLRDINYELLWLLVRYAKENHLIFYSFESEKIIKPSVEALLVEIEKSPKMKFVNDPATFFSNKEYLDKINKKALEKIDMLRNKK